MTEVERLKAQIRKLQEDRATLRAQRDRLAWFIRELGIDPTPMW